MTMISPSARVPVQLLHQEVKEQLVERLGKDWKAGDRLPSLVQLARQLGVGLQTAQKAVRELVDEGVLISRPRHGTFVIHDARHLDRTLEDIASRDTQPGVQTTAASGKKVCLAYASQRGMIDGMLAAMIAPLKQTLAAAGCQLSEQQLLLGNSWVETTHADAMVVVNPNSTSRIMTRKGQSLLVISTAGHAPVGVVESYDVVTVDQEQGAMLAGQRLQQSGCTTACYIGRRDVQDHSRYNTTSATRLRGFEIGWGQSLPEHYLFRTSHYAVDDGAFIASHYAKLADRPQAVFAASDELAVGFVLGLIAFGLKAGRDYSIVGFDGQQLGRELRQGALSTIEVPAALMGQRGAELLLDRLAKPQQPVRRLALGCSWFEGATVVSPGTAETDPTDTTF